MALKHRFRWAAAGFFLLPLATLAGLSLLLWRELDPSEAVFVLEILGAHPGYFFAAALVFIGMGLLAVETIWRHLILPVGQLVEETTLIQTANPSHRIQMDGNRDIQRLASAINTLAESCQQSRDQVDDRICQAKAEAESEKNILAAIVAELPQGVLICNTEGRILLYNPLAVTLLVGNRDEGGGEDQSYIGLGRSVFGVIERQCITYAIEAVSQRLARNSTDVSVPFAVQSRHGKLIRVEAVPVLDHRHRFSGLILLLNDISQDLEKDLEKGERQRHQIRQIRDALAGIRAAIEALLAYPSMQDGQRDHFHRIIHGQTIKLGQTIAASEACDQHQLLGRWPRLPMPFADLALTLTQWAREKLDIGMDPAGHVTGSGWVYLENYSMLMTLLALLDRLRQETGQDRFGYDFEWNTPLGALDLMWPGPPIPIETIRRWTDQRLAVQNHPLDLTMAQILAFHGSECWSGRLGDRPPWSFLRVLLPTTATPDQEVVRNPAILPQSRPEFYDFDLFNRPGQAPQVGLQSLNALSYTVFDTETTGLDTQNDEIISIGAVRVVNGRLLREEVFDQFVDPRRAVPAASTRFHGITGEMLLGQPPIETVLGRFRQFVADTILVGHNVAFDMRMLQMKEKASGVAFVNPVLDTLLLSAVIHPAHGDHRLEALARLLGVSIVGRHTALGDALVTGEIFLKMIPLLAQNGIVTLRDAVAASRKTYYARLKY